MKWAVIREVAAWSLVVVLLALQLISKEPLLAQTDATASQETLHDDGELIGSEIYSQLGACTRRLALCAKRLETACAQLATTASSPADEAGGHNFLLRQSDASSSDATGITVNYGEPPPGPAESLPPVGEPGARSPRLSYRRFNGAGALIPAVSGGFGEGSLTPRTHTDAVCAGFSHGHALLVRRLLQTTAGVVHSIRGSCRVPCGILLLSSMSLARATCNVLRATCNVLRATCNVLRATCNVLRATCNV
jgi:hypothetical protein